MRFDLSKDVGAFIDFFECINFIPAVLAGTHD